MNIPKQKPTPLTSILGRRIESEGPLRFDDFMGSALYDVEHGYYRKKKKRVGKSDDTDFYTSSTLKDGFTRLLTGFLEERIGPDLSKFTLIEWGGESGGLPWEDYDPGFAEIRRSPLGSESSFPSPAVHFSNELFDAQPFRRFIFHEGQWQEVFVTFGEEGEFREIFRPTQFSPGGNFPSAFPKEQIEGYRIDLPTGANTLLEKIIAPHWKGLFIAFDYGRTWENLLTETPQGSLRGYSRHKQTQNVFQTPGEIDLTGHICWDAMEMILQKGGFQDIRCERQEKFFVQNAPQTLQNILTSGDNSLDSLRREVAALLHPAHFGQAFQVLWAVRY